MNLNQRISYRNSLPQVSIWGFSSSSDEEKPHKKPKIQEKQASPSPDPPPAAEIALKEYGPTLKHEIKPTNPKLLEQLGYVNRNSRPPSSKKNEILPSLDMQKPDISASIQERKLKEQHKILQISQLIESQRSK